ncbi:unnamed protein product [Didymodactylos carnosus]|uniref:Uncharacterized protein n=1 Tax=Didymodactylos carnosus TaxID=1234261 RepID=A0A814KD72_9BILA|nr:unnamed protein product [Didymodactylos carnosus]CAF1049308.1 unnamed protein product [Didymodactylos carnosus]CAF3653403.1 unnamed protein product [Didymodactylos carnosus]CAF3818946.1 unnamed protein product [Didymodactylos carnosus]
MSQGRKHLPCTSLHTNLRLDAEYGSTEPLVPVSNFADGYTVFNRVDEVAVAGYLTTVTIYFYNLPVPHLAELIFYVIDRTLDIALFMVLHQYVVPPETITNITKQVFLIPNSAGMWVNEGQYVGVGFGPYAGSSSFVYRYMYMIHRSNLSFYITNTYPARFATDVTRGATFKFTIRSSLPAVTTVSPPITTTYGTLDNSSDSGVSIRLTWFIYGDQVKRDGYVQNLYVLTGTPNYSFYFNIVDAYVIPSTTIKGCTGVQTFRLPSARLNITQGQWLAVYFGVNDHGNVQPWGGISYYVGNRDGFAVDNLSFDDCIDKNNGQYCALYRYTYGVAIAFTVVSLPHQ